MTCIDRDLPLPPNLRATVFGCRRMALLAIALSLLTAPALARKADRDEPLDIKADGMQGVLDDDGKATLSGNVEIEQGSMDVHADTAVVTRAAGDFKQVVFEGKPATLVQTNDDGTPMKAQATRIEYNVDSDIVILTGNVHVEQERGTLRGERVTYNLTTGELDGGGGGGRVQMRVLPKAKPAVKEAN